MPGESDNEDGKMVWLCECGEIVETDLCCPRCHCEPPWGCDCALHESDPFDEYAEWTPDEQFEAADPE